MVKAHLTCRPDNGPYYPTDRAEAPRVRDRCGDGAGPRVSTTLFQCEVVKDQDKQHQLPRLSSGSPRLCREVDIFFS